MIEVKPDPEAPGTYAVFENGMRQMGRLSKTIAEQEAGLLELKRRKKPDDDGGGWKP